MIYSATQRVILYEKITLQTLYMYGYHCNIVLDDVTCFHRYITMT